MCLTDKGAVTIRQERERWFRRPQGEPSGVWTGHMKPFETSVFVL